MEKDLIIKESRKKVLLWVVLVLIILAYLCSMLYYSSVKKPAVIFSIIVATVILFIELRKFMNPKIVLKADKEGITNTTTLDFKTIKWNEIKEIYIYKKTFLNKKDMVTDNYICFNLKDENNRNKNKIDVDFSKKYDNRGTQRILITGCNENVHQIFNKLKKYYEKNISSK
ncbi:MAG: hypothetical protein SPD90_05140 [Intestinibacter sp.]|uniref:hypothetical protein n=1 Tax=Intestinibacter sp. TaxID=1965304 RepID=UPI002A8136A2|nr:hypothetical protein [Intestinibacter sp.]MDY4574420.1 hypothetical protein [Intestinibacter sp.]